MTIFSYSLHYLLSFMLGYLTLSALFKRKALPSWGVCLCLSMGLGFAISGSLTFFSLLLLSNAHKTFILACHIISLIILSIYNFHFKRFHYSPLHFFKQFKTADFIAFSIFILSLIPVWKYAQHTPFGGWDAWAVWNFKAKFIYLSGENWTKLFDPLLWRASPHYPLLLPLINVWAWLGGSTPEVFIPKITGILFTILTCGLLFSTIYNKETKIFALIAPLTLLTLPYFLTMATSQYCDLILGFYLLAGTYCYIQGIELKLKTYTFLSGVFWGIMGFTKPEGLVASGLLLMIGTCAFFLLILHKKQRLKTIIAFILGFSIASLPALLFKIFYQPENITFINGLISTEKPSSFFRLQMILAFLLVELFISQKWNFIWILLGTGILLNFKNAFEKKLLFIPLFLIGYMTIIIIYYYTNTYFEIRWWLQVSLSRILTSLLPTYCFWVFYSFKKK